MRYIIPNRIASSERNTGSLFILEQLFQGRTLILFYVFQGPSHTSFHKLQVSITCNVLFYVFPIKYSLFDLFDSNSFMIAFLNIYLLWQYLTKIKMEQVLGSPTAIYWVVGLLIHWSVHKRDMSNHSLFTFVIENIEWVKHN